MQNEKALIFGTYTNFKLPFHLCTLPLAYIGRSLILPAHVYNLEFLSDRER